MSDLAGRRVVVAMSGGVDSSVAAALLQQQGCEVIGMMLRLWSEPGKADSNRCCTPEAMGLARRVAASLKIPFYAVDVQASFREIVVEEFIRGYSAGITPNPCLVCNRQIRFGLLLEKALSIGADYLATGHYARILPDSSGKMVLQRGIDTRKDQSYVLSVLNQQQLQKALFPVGQYTKTEIREFARVFNLPVADRSDSQDLCFLAGGDYRDFLARTVPEIFTPGPIRDQHGNLLGEHRGLPEYTIGQRKGIGIASAEPLYVAEKDLVTNTLVVGAPGTLQKSVFKVNQVNWIAGVAPSVPIQADIQIRYRSREISGKVLPQGDTSVFVELAGPVRGITPGQAAVFYQNDICLGGGIIQSGSGI